jgi:DNA-binding MarR family transcriptional regulator
MPEQSLNSHNEFELLEALSATPVTTQADLAAQVGVAVGTVNWYLKRWSKKGYVKVKRIGRWQWSYLLTPEGIARKARLAGEYVEASLSLYRRTRTEARQRLADLLAAGHTRVVIAGEGEIADICRLTCLEVGVTVVEQTGDSTLPILRIEGVNLRIDWAKDRAAAPTMRAEPH